MKVLMINTINLEKNGVTTFILNACESLRRERVDVDIAASNLLSSDIVSFLNRNRIPFIKLPNRKKSVTDYFINLVKIMKKNNYDIVHVHGNSTTMAIELLAAKVAKVPVRIAHSHNTLTEHPVINQILRPLFNAMVNGRIACNTAAGKWLFKDKNFLVIKNGISLGNYNFNSQKRNDLRKHLGVTNKDILLGHVGFFNYQKNQEFFINLMKRLNDKYKLLLIGDGDLYVQFNKKVKENKLENRILSIGTVSNVPDYLSAMDMFLLPSRFEGQPFVIIEALAAGLPCVISNKVSKEIDVTKNSLFIPLNYDKWYKAIINKKPVQRELRCLNNQKILRQKGYDASRSGLILKKFYLSLKNKEKN